jgi:hypothetical protein
VPQPLWDVLTEQKEVTAALADPNRLRPIHVHFGVGATQPTLQTS